MITYETVQIDKLIGDISIHLPTQSSLKCSKSFQFYILRIKAPSSYCIHVYFVIKNKNNGHIHANNKKKDIVPGMMMIDYSKRKYKHLRLSLETIFTTSRSS